MKPINAAICSFGLSGRVFHAPFLHVLPQYNLYGVLERSKDLARALYPSVNIYRSLDEMLADEQVELVVVNTPNHTHFDFAKRSLLAGKHVLVEKPFTVTVAEAQELIDIANEKRLCLSIYQNRRYDSDYKIVRDVIEQQLLGDLVEMEINFARYKPSIGPKVHKETPGQGGGILYDLGSHIIDQALQLFGLPQRLFADIRMVRPGSQVDDYFEILLYYNRLRVRLRATQVARESTPGYVLQGLLGSFLKSRTNIQEEELQAGKMPGHEGWGIEPATEQGVLYTNRDGELFHENLASPRSDYAEFFEKLYHAIREGGEAPVTGLQALQVIRIIEAAFESSDSGKTVAIG